MIASESVLFAWRGHPLCLGTNLWQRHQAAGSDFRARTAARSVAAYVRHGHLKGVGRDTSVAQAPIQLTTEDLERQIGSEKQN